MSKLFETIEKAKIDWQGEQPYSSQFNDIYFDKKDGLSETRYVFIEGNNLINRWQNLTEESFVIAETGFGTGLNFLLTFNLWVKHAPLKAKLYFISTEKFPLDKADLSKALSSFNELSFEAGELLNSYPTLTPGYHYLKFLDGRINLILMLGDAENSFNQMLVSGDQNLEQKLSSKALDAIYLDGFAPSRNDDLWTSSLFQTLALLAKKGTTLATFSSASFVKHNLIEAGFKVSKKKGYGYKREMIVAEFEEIKETQLKQRMTPWHAKSKTKLKNKKAIILGAGFAGVSLASSLAKRGWQVKLMDANNDVSLGASANEQAVLYPNLSAFASPLTELMLSSFLFAKNVYKQYLEEGVEGELKGILQLAATEKEFLYQQGLSEWLARYPDLGILVNATQASALSGIAMNYGGIYIPGSGWLNSRKLCQFLIKNKAIELIANSPISELYYADNQWHCHNESAEILVLANGYLANQFKETAFLPLKAIRGQMTQIATTEASSNLKIPICGEGHILPAINGRHACGASYHLGSTDKQSYAKDDFDNLNKIKNFGNEGLWSEQIKENWVGIRGMTTDYLPLVGEVPKENDFFERFKKLSTNLKRWIPSPGVYYPGLYLCAGFGSRGLTTIPFCTEWLASHIDGDISFMPQKMIKSLSPARFLIKKIARS